MRLTVQIDRESSMVRCWRARRAAPVATPQPRVARRSRCRRRWQQAKPAAAVEAAARRRTSRDGGRVSATPRCRSLMRAKRIAANPDLRSARSPAARSTGAPHAGGQETCCRPSRDRARPARASATGRATPAPVRRGPRRELGARHLRRRHGCRVQASQHDLEASAADLHDTQVSLVGGSRAQLRRTALLPGAPVHRPGQPGAAGRDAEPDLLAGAGGTDVGARRRAGAVQRGADPRADSVAPDRAGRRRSTGSPCSSGQPPTALHDRLAGAGRIPAVPERVVVGIPADTLRQRPDVRAAERRCSRRATARVGQARDRVAIRASGCRAPSASRARRSASGSAPTPSSGRCSAA